MEKQENRRRMMSWRGMSIFLTVVIAASMMFNAQAKRQAAGTAKSIETFAKSLRDMESKKVATVNEYKNLKAEIEKLAVPYFKSAYNKRAKTVEQKTLAVLAQADEYAEKKLESGATFEMMDAGYIHKMSHSYNTYVAYEQMLNAATSSGERKAITSEIEAWLKLENVLREYCEYSSYLQTFGGSMAYLGVSGSAWSLAELRDKDLNDLNKIGFKATESKLSMSDLNKSATSLVLDMNNDGKQLLESIDDDTKSSQQRLFDSVSKGITDAGKQLQVAFPKWIEARKCMLRYSKQPAKAVEATSALLNGIKKVAEPER